MKSPLIFFLIFICTNFTNFITAQVKIGENPQILDPTSLLELESTSKVLVISRMTEAEILALSPLQGAMVYNIDASCIFYYDGTNWNNLCTGGSAGSISWGSITGDLADATELDAKFDDYVDLTNSQTIAGQKTLSDKLVVNTGTTADQVAEFLGRVKGEKGTAPEDFVTKSQLDATSVGGATWGTITGNLADATELDAKFDDYVDLTNSQTIAGQKTLSDKLVVNTGTTADQVAEFLGRVKGEKGTAPEDFVTKSQLDATSVGGATWGTITGNLDDATELDTKFDNYVDLTNPQSIAGEKTLTDKITVNTGALGDRAAEFLGRVKGENGTAPEDFVTIQQLDAVALTGASGTEGSIFFAGADTGLTENNNNLFWDDTLNQLRVGDAPLANSFPNAANNSTLNIKGSVSKSITFGVTGLNENHHTIIIDSDATIFLPDPKSCEGRMYIIKRRPGVTISTDMVYINSESIQTKAVLVPVLHLQSNGFQWEQIN